MQKRTHQQAQQDDISDDDGNRKPTPLGFANPSNNAKRARGNNDGSDSDSDEDDDEDLFEDDNKAEPAPDAVKQDDVPDKVES